MAKQLMHIRALCTGGLDSGVQIPDRPNLTQHYKWFTTASTFTQVAVPVAHLQFVLHYSAL